MKEGWELIGKGNAIMLKKGEHTIKFDIEISMPKGVLYAMYLEREHEVGSVAKDVKMTIKQAHDKLGHSSEDNTRKTAKQLGWEITPGTLRPCESCAAGKAKQKNVPKLSDGEPAEEGKIRIYLDIATVKRQEGQPKASKPNWRIMVDERTQLKFSDFFKTKNAMVEPTCEQFQKWKDNGKAVTFVRLDNAGENKLLKK
jgi:hypothetical protein